MSEELDVYVPPAERCADCGGAPVVLLVDQSASCWSGDCKAGAEGRVEAYRAAQVAAGPPTDEDLTARVRAQMEAGAAEAAANGYVPPPDEHGMRGGVKWRIDGVDPELPTSWEGGCLCHCGELFVRTGPQGGWQAAWRALIEHEGGVVVGG